MLYVKEHIKTHIKYLTRVNTMNTLIHW